MFHIFANWHAENVKCYGRACEQQGASKNDGNFNSLECHLDPLSAPVLKALKIKSASISTPHRQHTFTFIGSISICDAKPFFDKRLAQEKQLFLSLGCKCGKQPGKNWAKIRRQHTSAKESSGNPFFCSMQSCIVEEWQQNKKQLLLRFLQCNEECSCNNGIRIDAAQQQLTREKKKQATQVKYPAKYRCRVQNSISHLVTVDIFKWSGTQMPLAPCKCIHFTHTKLFTHFAMD